MNKDMAMLRAYPKDEIIDMLMEESKVLIEEEVEQKRRILAMKALIQNNTALAEEAQKITTESVLASLRKVFKQAQKSAATYFLYKMRDSIKNGKTEKFDPEQIMSTGEPKVTLDQNDAKVVQERIFQSQPSDHIYMSIRESLQLKELWETQKNIKAANVPSDIFFSDEIAIRDMIITITNDNRIVSRKFKTTRNVRIVIFDNPISNPKDPDEPFVVGAISIEVNVDPTPPGVDFPRFTVPLLIQRGFNGIGMADMYNSNKRGKIISISKDGNILDRETNMDVIWADIENYLKIWYGIQLALLHPIIQNVFKHPTTEKIAHEEPKKGGKTRTVYTYIKKHVIRPHDFDPPAPSDNGEKTPRNWSTLLWHVTGHWRYYKDGKKVFVKPYWKGPLRDIKAAEPRNRRIAIPKTIQTTDQTPS